MPTRYLIASIMDITTDVFLASLPIYLVMPVETSLETKLKVVGTFALRLTLVALATVSCVFWQDSLHSKSLDTARASALALQEAQLWWSIIVCMAIRLMKLIKLFNTGSGMGSNFTASPIQGGIGIDCYGVTHNTSSSTRKNFKLPVSGTPLDIELAECASQKSTVGLCS
jgi:hypothetical protein